MKKSILPICAVAAIAMLGVNPLPVAAAGAYKCKAKTSFGQMTLTFKNGRARGGGFTFQTKVLSDGSVRLTYIGESAVLGADGQVKGRNGASTGPHNCDMAAVRSALEK